MNCFHEKAYYFHDNAPMYCPDCKQYINDTIILKRNKLVLRKKKINKILTKI